MEFISNWLRLIMLVKGNISCNVSECLKMGKTKFIKAHEGLYNGDINELWELIEKSKQVKK